MPAFQLVTACSGKETLVCLEAQHNHLTLGLGLFCVKWEVHGEGSGRASRASMAPRPGGMGSRGNQGE